MSHVTKSELEGVFLDVRKAYRLLYYYQRRVLDTVKFIGDTLSKNVLSGYSLLSNNSPRNGSRINMDSWAWDWLNMVFYEFYFTEETKGKDKIRFAVAVLSDSGFYDASESIKQTSLEEFAPPELSKTRLLLYASRNTWKPEGFTSFFKSESKTELVKEHIAENKIFVAKSFALSDFVDENSIIARLQEFITFCSQNGLPEFTAVGLRQATASETTSV